MRTICEEVNVSETFWPRHGEMIIVLLKALKGTVASVTFQSKVNICKACFDAFCYETVSVQAFLILIILRKKLVFPPSRAQIGKCAAGILCIVSFQIKCNN